jgi:hypothetical protein
MKETIVILDDGRTYSSDATVAKVSAEVMEKVRNDEDQLLEDYFKVGVDAVTAADCILEISEILSASGSEVKKLQRIRDVLQENITGIYPPGVTPAWMK